MGITKQHTSISEKTASAKVEPRLMDPAMASSSHVCLFGKQKEKTNKHPWGGLENWGKKEKVS